MINVKRTIDNLKNNGFDVQYFETKEEVRKALLEEIPADSSVGFGGSITVKDLNIYEDLKERGNKVYWHWKAGENESRKEILKNAANADIFISSTNAITESGRLVNIDATCNRITGIIYGHEKVFIVAGTNKIARNSEEALIRIKTIVAPRNAKRLGVDTPCVETGKCMNCNSPERICRATLIIDKQPWGNPITIFLVNEELGY
ncbi:MAG: LUD domain-containing protein [Clostridiales bacterium]|nr:LUD domain-containing protein [Clostridiales bacterium]